MATLLVLGAGLGGVPVAYELRAKLRDDDKVIVVSDKDYYHFVPSNPWIVVGWRRPENTMVHLAEPLAKKGIEFVEGEAARVRPKENFVELKDGRVLHYDQLIIATGPKPAFEEIEGFGPDHYSHSIVHIDHAIKAREAWEHFVENPGHIVVGTVQGSSCFGPAYEFAFILDRDLRERHMRKKVTITFVTPEPYIGHLGYGGVSDSQAMLESQFKEHNIEWICNARVDRVGKHVVEVTELDGEGRSKAHHSLRSDFTMLIPAFSGIDALQGIEGLVDEDGFVVVDAHQRNPTFKNIWSIGVAVAIPPLEHTPVPIGVPKAGFMIESMVTAAAQNIRAVLDGNEPEKEATWNAVYLADMGNTGIAFVALPQIPPRKFSALSEGKWVHLAKVAFESYFLNKIRQGNSEHVYEHYVMDALKDKK